VICTGEFKNVDNCNKILKSGGVGARVALSLFPPRVKGHRKMPENISLLRKLQEFGGS
jgi:hypothetical protein